MSHPQRLCERASEAPAHGWPGKACEKGLLKVKRIARFRLRRPTPHTEGCGDVHVVKKGGRERPYVSLFSLATGDTGAVLRLWLLRPVWPPQLVEQPDRVKRPPGAHSQVPTGRSASPRLPQKTREWKVRGLASGIKGFGRPLT